MKRIFKYPFPKTEPIKLPAGSKPIHVGEQNGKVRVWAEVPVEPWVGRKEVEVIVTGTGHEVPDDYTFLGTLILCGDQLVLHFHWKQL